MRKAGLTEAGFREAMGEVQAIFASLDTLPNIVGPTYGAAVCDRAMKIDRALCLLALGLQDEALDRAISLERADHLPPKFPAKARNELDGSFPPDTPVKARHWPPLTAREHHALGLRLKDARDRATGLFVTLSNAFPLSSPRRLVGRAKKVERALLAIRNERDTRAHIDCPAYRDCPPGYNGIGPARSWYYGHTESEIPRMRVP
jgi:hypothetical protein